MIDLTEHGIEPDDINYIELRTLHKYNIDEWLKNWDIWSK